MKHKRDLSKYRSIYESLRELILAQRGTEERYLPSERELVAQYGADRLTVRRALNLLVDEGLVVKQPGKGSLIRSIPDEDRWSSAARSIAFVLPRGVHSVDRINEPFNATLFGLLGRELELHGYHIVYATVGEDGLIPATLFSNAVQGLILVSQVPEPTIQQAQRAAIPTVLINRVSDHFPMILEDRFQGFSDLLEHVYQAGHRRILFINGVPGHYTVETCDAAFNAFLTKREGDGVLGMVHPSYWDYESGREVMAQVLQSERDYPTVVCGCNDTVALGAMATAKAAGIAVPREMSFVGFDDTDQCTRVAPQLTTVSVNAPWIARGAVNTLFAAITHGNPGPIRTIVPTAVVIRESLGPAITHPESTEVRT